MVHHHARSRGWRGVFAGVYALTQAPLTRRQRWIAATLTTPASVLSHASAGACWGFRPWQAGFETITRPGSGGRRQRGGLLICHSHALSQEITSRDGIVITTAARTLIDLAPHLPAHELGRATREALRLKCLSADDLRAALERHRGRRGTRRLAELATRYAALPYARARSDAESRALEILHDAGVEPPRLNVRIAAEEADLVWEDRKLIVEIDGPQFHRFPEEDARKQGRWEAAGYVVERVSSNVVYHEPERLLAIVSRSP